MTIYVNGTTVPWPDRTRFNQPAPDSNSLTSKPHMCVTTDSSTAARECGQLSTNRWMKSCWFLVVKHLFLIRSHGARSTLKTITTTLEILVFLRTLGEQRAGGVPIKKTDFTVGDFTWYIARDRMTTQWKTGLLVCIMWYHMFGQLKAVNKAHVNNKNTAVHSAGSNETKVSHTVLCEHIISHVLDVEIQTLTESEIHKRREFTGL